MPYPGIGLIPALRAGCTYYRARAANTMIGKVGLRRTHNGTDAARPQPPPALAATPEMDAATIVQRPMPWLLSSVQDDRRSVVHWATIVGQFGLFIALLHQFNLESPAFLLLALVANVAREEASTLPIHGMHKEAGAGTHTVENSRMRVCAGSQGTPFQSIRRCPIRSPT